MNEIFIKKTSRNFTLDLLKGFAILNIIFIHTIFWSGSSYANDTLRQLSLIIDVPLFFFLSGWAVNYQRNNIKAFISRIFKLYFQYVIMIIFMIALLILIFRHDVFSLPIISYLTLNYSTSSFELPVIMGSMWFFQAFLIVYMLTPLLLLVNKNKQNSMFLLLILLLLVPTYTFLNNGIWNNLISLTSVRAVAFYTLFYFAGIVFFDKTISIKQCVFNVIGVLLVLFLYLSSYGQSFNLQANKAPPTLLYFIASLPSIIIALYSKNMENYFNNHANNRLLKLLDFCGKNVFTIYLYQGFGASLLYFIIPYLIPYIGNWVILLILCYLINLFITLCLAVVFVPINKKMFEYISLIINNIKRGITSSY